MTTKEELACCFAYAKIKGEEEGRKEGLEKGRKEGLEEGRKKGIEESRKAAEKETKLQMVDAMLANDIPVEKIAVISGIPQEEILKRRT